MASPDVALGLEWQGDLRFSVQLGERSFPMDGDKVAGISPVESLAAALAGCMAVDVVHILERMRTPASALRVSVEGRRAGQDPRRLVAVQLRFVLEGDVPEKSLRRALELSRDRYCSVGHSLREDIELTLPWEITAPEGTLSGTVSGTAA